jgi:hypothetical protein
MKGFKMGNILDELISETSKHDKDEQMRIICDAIMKEEIENITDYEGPTGPNIFLSLPVEIPKARTEDYICLERESKGVFIISHWSCLKSSEASPKRVKVWPSKYDDIKKILKEFTERIVFLKGE